MRSLCTASCSYPILSLPDITKLFQIESYASDTTVLSICTQEQVSSHKSIFFLRKTLTSSEKTTVSMTMSC